MSNDDREMKGKAIKIQDLNSSANIGQNTKLDPTNPKSIFIENLDYWTSDQDILDILTAQGNIPISEIVTSELGFLENKLGKSRGVCFVLFKSAGICARAHKLLNNHSFEDKVCIVKWGKLSQTTNPFAGESLRQNALASQPQMNVPGAYGSMGVPPPFYPQPFYGPPGNYYPQAPTQRHPEERRDVRRRQLVFNFREADRHRDSRRSRSRSRSRRPKSLERSNRNDSRSRERASRREDDRNLSKETIEAVESGPHKTEIKQALYGLRSDRLGEDREKREKIEHENISAEKIMRSDGDGKRDRSPESNHDRKNSRTIDSRELRMHSPDQRGRW